MWKTIVIALCIFLFSFAFALNAEESRGPQLTFETEGYDCGTLYFEDVDIKTIEIKFSNTGNAPLLLGSVRACCGTVVTFWPSEPILPGENAKIEVRFRVANRPHLIRRVVSVESNDIYDPRKRFHITGRVNQKSQ